MPRYYFHVASRVPSEDETGIALPNMASAGTEAARRAMELARVNRVLAHAVTRGDIIVTDDTGKTILTFSVPTRRRPHPLRADR
jgi:hypothetical protein